ncbi:hypothetical protein BHE74_00040844, partial [Ensete ventricosum]
KSSISHRKSTGKVSLGGILFRPGGPNKLIPSNFRFLTLEAYDGSSDSIEHIAAF